MTIFLLGLLIGFLLGMIAHARSIQKDCEFGIIRFGEDFYKVIKTDPRKPPQ